MSAGLYNFGIEQGADFQRVITVKNEDGSLVDLTGCGAKLEIKTDINNDMPVILLTSGSGLILGGTQGTITVTLTAAQTALFEFDPANYSLIIISSSGLINPLIKGTVTLDKEAVL